MAQNLLASPNIDCICCSVAMFTGVFYMCPKPLNPLQLPWSMVSFLGEPIWSTNLLTLRSQINCIWQGAQFNPIYQDLPLACRSAFIPTGQNDPTRRFLRLYRRKFTLDLGTVHEIIMEPFLVAVTLGY